MATTAKQASEVGKPRPKRTPVGGPRDILSVMDKDENYVYRWVNDVDNRISRFLDAGYEFVTDDLEIGQKAVDRGSKLGSAITKSVGGRVTAVLMRIPKEWYDEDQVAKQEEINSREASLRADQVADYGVLTVKRNK